MFMSNSWLFLWAFLLGGKRDMLDEDVKERAKHQRAKIVKALRKAGLKGLTNVELIQNITPSLGARMSELYERGYSVDVRKIRDGVYRYVLLAEPIKPYSKPKRATDIILEEILNRYDDQISSQALKSLLDRKGFIVCRRSGSYKIC